ncbi:MAG: ATP-binding cassette domain-containing protein [Coriobacteriales bacterium]|nr:ATP-binding cassette domain-containing protein [Coriobacteriales bacterium]
MLQLEHISKSYTTNAFTQVALDNVSVAFRDNEFVSILGPSGSGKTTMLNVIGGLDHFDEGDLLIDGISTKEYRDRDWDAYRNNRIGFVFQSYNLIPHQTVLANVELALTLSGVTPAERKNRARKALEDVGLGEHVDKRPSQLSGGQMQRVAIARALINDPEILLADEPTGALDSHTSVQVMDLLREVASDRLVIMVTHNPELAHEYSTRIVELCDGRISSDSDPFVPSAHDLREARPGRRTSMSFLTALSLSFNNLMTKKGRTLMTAFAGSIGIIGIAAILALANGVNAYIQEVEEETLSVYPLQIMSSGLDLTSMLVDAKTQVDEGEENAQVQSDSAVAETRMVTSMFGSVGKNDLASLKEYLDNDGGGIGDYVQDIEYVYGVVPRIFYLKQDGKAQQVNPDTSFESLGMGSSSSLMSSSSTFSTNVFAQMPEDVSLLEDQFDVKAGHWPSSYDEMVLVLSRKGTISDFMSYALGMRNHQELEDMVRTFVDQEEVEAPSNELSFSYEELMAREFRVVPASSLYVYEKDYGVWTDKSDDKEFVSDLVRKAQKLKIAGVVQPKEDVDATTISMGVYYTPALTYWLMEQAAGAKIVKEQLANPSINVISGRSFDAEADQTGGDFDMSSLFSIDQDKLAEAFSMDTSKMDLSGLDMSGMEGALDLSSLAGSADLSSMALSQMDLSSLDLGDLSNLSLDLGDIDLSGVDLSGIDLSKVDLSGVDFEKLILNDLRSIMESRIQKVDLVALFDGVSPTVDQKKIQPLVQSTLKGLMGYLTQKGVNVTDSDAVIAAVSEYVSSPEVLSGLFEGLRGAVSFSEQDQEKLAQNLLAQLTKSELTKKEQKKLRKDANRLARVIAMQLGEQVGEQVNMEMAQKIASAVSSSLQEQITGALASTLATALQSYMTQVMGTYFSQIAESLQTQLTAAISGTMQGAMEQLMSNMAGSMHIDEEAFAKAFQFNMDQKELSELMVSLLSTERTSYEGNLSKLGYANKKKPSEIDIYPLNFDSKAEVISILDAYNDERRDAGEDDKVITYTDIVGALMSSVTEIVNMISYVLIAFVAISLVVSSIMIGVITYISVLERKKEIGILRSIGASKRDVSRVFNAETVIEGLVSGVMGVGITALACIPANIIVEEAFNVVRVARLPVTAAMVLVGVSVLLSFVAGLIPSRKAAKADPVEALRSE